MTLEINSFNYPNVQFHHPALKLVEKEGKGFWLITTQEIPRGTLLLTEKPLVHFHGEIADESDGGATLDDWLKDNVDEQVLERVLSLEDCNMWIGEKSFLGITKTNGLAAGPIEDEEDWQYDHIVIHHLISRINHSCKPNIRHLWDQKLKVHHIRSTKLIPADTELCTCYIPVFQRRHERSLVLKKAWNFICQCEACHPMNPPSDSRRVKISELDGLIEAEASVEPELAMKHVQQRLDLMAEEEVFDEMGRTCTDGFQICCAWGDAKSATEWLRVSMKWDNFLNGYISEEKQEWLKSGVTTHPEWRAALDVPSDAVTFGATFPSPNAHF